MNFKIVEYNNVRVLTTQQIAEAYDTSTDTITKNFNRNKDRYAEGKHYIALEGAEKNDFLDHGQFDRGLKNAKTLYLWTEKGAFLHAKSLNTDKAWEVYDKLVDFYFGVKKTISEELSPQMQLLMQMVNTMAQKELEDKERDRQIAIAKEAAEKAVQTTEKIKDEFVQTFDNWRDDINRKVRQISQNSGISYQQLFTDMYKELERSGYDLAQRQRNKRNRMLSQGCTKSETDRETTKIAIVEDDKKAKKIFGDIVARYAVKYIA